MALGKSPELKEPASFIMGVNWPNLCTGRRHWIVNLVFVPEGDTVAYHPRLFAL